MTLEEARNKALALLDEYAPSGARDAELEARLTIFLDSAQKELAQIKKIICVYVVARQSGQTEYPMPPDFLGLFRVRRNGRPCPLRYRWKGNAIVIPAEDGGQVEVEYFALPATLTAATPGSYRLEIAEDAAQAVPFFAAAQVLAADLVQDGSVLMTMYRMLVDALDTTLPGVNVRAGNTLFRA